MKNWNLRLGRVVGIPIEIHWTFWLLLLYVFVGDFSDTGDTKSAFIGVATVLAIFTCVVLHELGHAVAALKFGINTRDITLYPIGGVARLESIPEKPSQNDSRHGRPTRQCRHRGNVAGGRGWTTRAY